ncbi:hypothetical protein PPE03_15170 [Pseudoalteromonas peptidolytica]|nr:hypothetical protein PPE03_15170 [Pseudoalteromonas peptidolytica]
MIKASKASRKCMAKHNPNVTLECTELFNEAESIYIHNQINKREYDCINLTKVIKCVILDT